MAVTIFSPAKLNLYLAVTGRREDGFHDLVSVAAPLEFGDELSVEARPGGRFTLECDADGVPTDESNLVVQAAHSFAAETGWKGGAHFRLTKRIPAGAGLGGGSSNAVAGLRALSQLAAVELPADKLAVLAAKLGSDCPLFLAGVPVVMRGRGERVEALPPRAAARLRGRRVVVFKPSVAVSTPWAYARMVKRGGDYVPVTLAEAKLAVWLQGDAPAEELVGNAMQPAVFEKYPALPLLLAKLVREFGVAAAMSGSGSACFALLDEHRAESELLARICECWGERAVVAVTRVA